MLSPLEVIRLYPPHNGTLASMLKSRVSVAAQREFLVFQGQSFTYQQVLSEVQGTASVLQSKGVKAGDRVGTMSANHPSSVFLLVALASLGAIMVPVNPDYGVEEARYVLTHADVCGVLCSPAALPTVLAACDQLPSMPWLLLNDAAPGDEVASKTPVLSQEVRSHQNQNPRTHQKHADADADAVCLFIYTSGTTGFPKGVMHSQRSLLTAGEGFVARMHLQPQDRLLCVLPLFHINAIFYSFAGALAAGAVLILKPRFSASSFWRVVKETRATEVNTIAAAATILMRRPRSEFVPGHQLKKMYGAPFDEENYRVWQQEFGVPTLIEGYGMSEIPGALNNPFNGPHKVRSMGQPSRHPDPSIPLGELRITDDNGHVVPVGVTGELVVRTPIVMKGYYKDEAQTRAAFRDGWFLTGDLAYVDADNYFWFVARKKDIIRKKGENISGAELDRVVGSHPAVTEAAAIPVPSDLGEDEILMAVILRSGMALRHEEIAQWCRERLAAIKVPRYVVFVDALPHTPTHRVAKFKMRDDPLLLKNAVDLALKQPL
jgi:crotonobetaine/carnitine-CoA ligase